jgi:hypothetical protein
MGSTRVDAPPPLDYGQQTRDTLQAQIDLAPQKYAAEAEFAPRYQGLQLGLLEEAAPRLMDLYTKQIMPQLTDMEMSSRSQARDADIADVERYGLRAKEAMRAASPEQAQLVDSMTRRAQAGIDAGSALTPEQTRSVQQSARAAYGDRGMLGSGRAGLDEIVGAQMAGAGMEQQRAGNAMQALGASQAMYGDQFQQILGRPSQAFGQAQGYGGQAQGFNPGQLFNPESQMAADFANQGYQGTLAARTASAANSSALTGAALSAAGSAL